MMSRLYGKRHIYSDGANSFLLMGAGRSWGIIQLLLYGRLGQTYMHMVSGVKKNACQVIDLHAIGAIFNEKWCHESKFNSAHISQS